MLPKFFSIGNYKFLLSRDSEGWQVTNSENQTFSIRIGYVICIEDKIMIYRLIVGKYELVWCKI